MNVGSRSLLVSPIAAGKRCERDGCGRSAQGYVAVSCEIVGGPRAGTSALAPWGYRCEEHGRQEILDREEWTPEVMRRFVEKLFVPGLALSSKVDTFRVRIGMTSLSPEEVAEMTQTFDVAGLKGPIVGAGQIPVDFVRIPKDPRAS